jgi:hypothetical protein
VLIIDITDEILRTQVAKAIDIPYLKGAMREEVETKVDVGHGPL